MNNALENNWGNINLYQATANSVNTVFMNVNEHLTPKRTAAIAHEAGIQGDIDENSMYNVLGINALTVWDLAQGHSTIANNGVKNTLHMVSKVLDSNNKDMYNAPSNGTKVFDANDCALVQKGHAGHHHVRYGGRHIQHVGPARRRQVRYRQRRNGFVVRGYTPQHDECVGYLESGR